MFTAAARSQGISDSFIEGRERKCFIKVALFRTHNLTRRNHSDALVADEKFWCPAKCPEIIDQTPGTYLKACQGSVQALRVKK